MRGPTISSTKKGVLILLLLLVAGIATAGDVTFNFQGRVRVGGQTYSGSGQFKFAIVDASGNVSLWSNDGTSVGGAQPTNSVNVTVSEGVFTVMIGDPVLGMQPINSAIFNSQTPLKLRTWFSDGIHGFEQLHPDNNLNDVTLQALSTSESDFAVYVNGTTGNDANNGLTPATAKKTIQAAVSTLPSRLNCNVTVDVAAGVYTEQVKIYGITIAPGKKLTILGDESWTRSRVAPPDVKLVAPADGTTETKRGVYAINCAGVALKGLHFQNFSYGVAVENGAYEIANCLADTNSIGFRMANNASGKITECTGASNTYHGFEIGGSSSCFITDCDGHHNGNSGVMLNGKGMGMFSGVCAFNDNGSGIAAIHASAAVFYDTYTGTATRNSYGISMVHFSYTENHTRNNLTGNTIAPIQTLFGSMTTY